MGFVHPSVAGWHAKKAAHDSLFASRYAGETSVHSMLRREFRHIFRRRLVSAQVATPRTCFAQFLLMSSTSPIADWLTFKDFVGVFKGGIRVESKGLRRIPNSTPLRAAQAFGRLHNDRGRFIRL
jgi:hypothetical protein